MQGVYEPPKIFLVPQKFFVGPLRSGLFRALECGKKKSKSGDPQGADTEYRKEEKNMGGFRMAVPKKHYTDIVFLAIVAAAWFTHFVHLI